MTLEQFRYRGYSQEALEAQYDVERSVDDLAAYQARYAQLTQQVRVTHRCFLDLAYGDGPSERLDIYPAKNPEAPVHVFMHGGGWRTSSKDGRGFPAQAFVAAGVTFVSIDYPQFPGVEMGQIVDAVRRAVVWVWRHIKQYNGDPARIHLSGHSSGAHLAAMATAGGWAQAMGAPEDLVKSLCGLSGLYDLEPHTIVQVRSYMNLTPETARVHSPVHQLPKRPVPVLLAVGADEPAEFLRQSADYARALGRAGICAELLQLQGHNHFSILGDLDEPDGLLFRRMHALTVPSTSPVVS
jgi:arylformamidase